jgi:hypothetical protein
MAVENSSIGKLIRFFWIQKYESSSRISESYIVATLPISECLVEIREYYRGKWFILNKIYEELYKGCIWIVLTLQKLSFFF